MSDSNLASRKAEWLTVGSDVLIVEHWSYHEVMYIVSPLSESLLSLLIISMYVTNHHLRSHSLN